MRRLVTPLLALWWCGGCGPSPAPAAPSDVGPSEDEPLRIEGGIDSLRRVELTTLGPPLAAHQVLGSQPVKLDGLIREWPQLSAATEREGAPSVQLAAAVQYDGKNLYLAADVGDDSLQRTSQFAASEDHVALVLAVPSGGKWVTYEIGLFAGVPGESAGSVRFLAGAKQGREVPGAAIVEAPRQGGYTLEAKIPWAALPEAAKVKLGLRAALRLVDRSGVVATGAGDARSPQSLPQLLTEPENALVDGFLRGQGLADKAPSLDLLADLDGDGVRERVAVYGSYLTVVGPNYRGGREFFYRDLGGSALSLEARSLLGGSAEQLVLVRPLEHPHGQSKVLEVWAFRNDAPQVLLAQEIEVRGESQSIQNRFVFKGSTLRVEQGSVSGWDAGSYRPVDHGGIGQVLTPWGTVKSRSWSAQGGELALKEERQAGSAAASVQNAQTASTADLPRDLPSPPVKTKSQLSEEQLVQVKRDRGVAASERPRFNLESNFAEDARPERAVLLGRDLAVFGPGFRGGAGYVYATLDAFSRDEDVREVSAKDLTGDGQAELIVRGTRRMGSGAEEVQSELTLIYDVSPQGMRRIFTGETAREQGGKRVQGLLQFVPSSSGRGFEIDVRAGVAKGFSASNYPWQEEAPGGTVEPLLLPWGQQKALRYRFDGGRYVAQP